MKMKMGAEREGKRMPGKGQSRFLIRCSDRGVQMSYGDDAPYHVDHVTYRNEAWLDAMEEPVVSYIIDKERGEEYKTSTRKP